ncbi:3-oxoacyl-ACP reductase [Brevibacillus sp. H7]|jgi:acetoacetyl-CoA reductase|uniref:3-oxoacyl-ACP reductase n=1 Tax=Brevibacillus sp. H7 TaxID=3349138 RepID=UPI00381B283A
MSHLQGFVGIVTGGSRGIGASIVRELAQQGVHLVINYQCNADAAETLVQEVQEEFGVKALAVQADVSLESDAKRLVHTAKKSFNRLDILVNNAGITRDRTFKKLSVEDWNKVIEVNLNSVFYVTHSALPYLQESPQGRIVNISSIIGQAGGFGQTNYSAAKAGMIGFTKSLALELAKTAVTVNSICPGFIETDMLAYVPEEVREQIKSRIPQRRFGQPEEIAKAVSFLVKDGGYITGQSLNVNGGLYM